ncbi:Ubiquitin-conjugating enzyme E2,Ubiquitin-conjugating enzyme/RWD-like,Ubiquitin-conjugating enzyme [Cinara cedri]|uniref:Ubiquitin-conjugating enzyme E2,Ubiquitin-conjugating enzyme/RWD-like,Ubiquitin-conjugating enzyme n=1 Tax=Cinara cedri TaxID=506608 RepID=A0A5E4MJP3_9HEMI|nr:Ubiquitin-conjugating enzyme E2,Ubiquitin-conjugating enzyme/RWD-like,Ubiquitin-conjugating enzyme [Cinara cedri]
MFNKPRLKKELSELIVDPPIGIKVNIKENSLNILEAEINGPKDSPYEDGVFKLIIEVLKDYPFEAPRINFITPIYHPNINRIGRICLHMLNKSTEFSWKPMYTIKHALVAIRNLMDCPNPDDPMLSAVAKEYTTNKDVFEYKAKKFTKMYATMRRTNTQ